MIFHTAHRFNGSTYEPLAIAEAKQIAGRAGRYRTAAQAIKQDLASNLDLIGKGVSVETSDLVGKGDSAGKSESIDFLASPPHPSPPPPPALPIAHEASMDGVELNGSSASPPSSSPPPPPTSQLPAGPEEQTVGLVTTLDKLDFSIISRAMASDPEPMTSAGIQPPAYIIEQFARYYPDGTPFAYLLIRLNELAKTSGRFHLCDLRQAIAIADAIESVEGLTTTDRLVFVSSPIEPRKNESALARTYAELIAQNKGVSIAEIKELDLELLREDYTANRIYLRKLEALHKGVIVWMWLSYRFAGIFINRELAAHVKELVEKRIEDVLQAMSFDFNNIKKRRDKAILDMLENETQQETKQSQDGDEDDAGDEMAKMPEDPTELSEWLRGLASKETESGLEMPASDLKPQLQKEPEDEAALHLSDREVLEPTEPSSATASESLLDEVPEDQASSISPVNQGRQELDVDVDGGQQKSSPFTPPEAPPGAAKPANPNFFL